MVQFYETDDILTRTVSRFLLHGLFDGDAAVVIATEEHRAVLAEELSAAGVDLRDERYISLDAADTLRRFMVMSMPAPLLFERTMSSIIDRSGRGGRRVRIFGEMVSLLWAEGNVPAVLRLEHLWNELAAVKHFALLCSYPSHGFDGAENAETLRRIQEAHA